MLLEGVVVHGVLAVLIIVIILAIIGFGVVGLFRALAKGAKSVSNHALDDERPR